MPFVPVANTTELVVHAKQQGQDRVSVLHYRWDTVPTVGQLLGLIDDFVTRVLPSWEAACHTSVAFESVSATNINAAGGNTASRQLVGPYVGTRTGTAYPGNVSLALSKRTGQVGRRKHGRTYMYGLINGDFIQDLLQSTITALLTTLASKLLLQLAGGGVQFAPAVASRINGTSTVMTSVLFDTVADSQRKRLVNRGQ